MAQIKRRNGKNISFGDTIIQGSASMETVKQHTKVTYDMVDQISRILKIKL